MATISYNNVNMYTKRIWIVKAFHLSIFNLYFSHLINIYCVFVPCMSISTTLQLPLTNTSSSDDTVGDLKKLIAAQTGTKWDRIVLKKWYVGNAPVNVNLPPPPPLKEYVVIWYHLIYK